MRGALRMLVRAGAVGPHVRQFKTTASPERIHGTHGERERLELGWLRWLLLGGATSSAFVHGFKSHIYADDMPRLKSDYVGESAAEQAEPSIQTENRWKPWHGLDMLRSAWSATALTAAMSEWSWPVALDFSAIRTRLSIFFEELSLGPGSLYSEVVDTPPDPRVYPEIEWDAEVRLGEDLCLAERAFVAERQRAMRTYFAQLMGVPDDEVDERDLPVVAIAGSGGGFRAMLNTVGSLCGAKTTGILDCVTYTAGVSGSCWALGVMHSGVSGSHLPHDAARHLKDRIQTSYLDMDTLDALINPPTNKYLLYSLLRKAAGPKGTISLVDVYGTLLGSRILVPSDLSRLDPQQLSMHLMRKGVDRGQLPMPIFTAIQHAIPPVAIQAIRDLQSEKTVDIDSKRADELDQAQARLSDITSRFFWYEFTPYEVGCDEIGAWIPSWAFGREFYNGRNLERRPELGFTILAGIFGSAFCASLKLYFREIQPTLELFPSQLYNWLLEIVSENERDLGLIHPVLPDQVPNFLRGLHGQLRSGSPSDLADREYMTFMDAGAELNIPYYPLLRRNVDCIIALDASADSQDLWFTRAEELAARRGLRTWPRGASWPAEVLPSQLHAQDNGEGVDPADGDEEARAASRKLAESQESALAEQTHRQSSTDERGIPDHDESAPREYPLRSCEVWIGSSESNEADSARLDDLDEDALLRRDGIGIVYIPLAPNEARVPGFDPFVVSTWRREVAPAESQALLDVAEANFTDSREKIVRLLRAIWLRKKRERTQAEWRAHLRRFERNLRRDVF
ncbi:FabD/lysophospholipase-like protein [Phanerochaete sordida]|uniref:Lysophospholipase n=1 Tax=Phanerochaete sordida TaxID=48140 RepID=A0A9P3GKF3_9APHY|nr:FabD/lysophospholipase-like protein [Phanerochaete sordida]